MAEEDECEICGNKGAEEALVDSEEYMKLCKDCAHVRNAVVLEKPSDRQVSNISRSYTEVGKIKLAAEIAGDIKRQNLLDRMAKKIAIKAMMAREEAGLTRAQLSEKIYEPEIKLNRFERGASKSKDLIVKFGEFFCRDFIKEAADEIKQEESEEKKEITWSNSKDLKIADLKKMRDDRLANEKSASASAQKNEKEEKEAAKILQRLKEEGIA